MQTKKDLFSAKALKKLIWPLILEQILSITIGLADTIMVSSVGEAAVSGVSLVDMLNVLIINIFAALATGGAVVVAQLLGSKERERACDAAKQLYFVVTLISIGIATIVMLLREPLLRLLFGSIEPDVMQSALTYLTISIFSYPVLAIYNAGAALFRAQGNSCLLYTSVRGDSMNAARIYDGDIVIIRRQDIVENGEIAAVLIDDQDATLKRFSRHGDIVTLMPQSTNPVNQPFVYDLKETTVKILGLVVKVEFRPQ